MLTGHLRKVQITLRSIKQKGKFTKSEYMKLYPNDPTPPRMYGVIKEHKPEKQYPIAS